MSFSASSTSWELKHGHKLKAVAKNREGHEKETEIDLNTCIGNSDGWFVWGGQNFSHSASEIELRGTKLCAKLTKRDGGHRDYQGIELNDKITNDNGKLKYTG